MQALSVKNVGVNIGGKALLSDITFSINSGEILAVVGPNGAGKTTLLNAISDDIRRTSGDIAVCGKALDEWTFQSRARHFAILPQLSLLNFPYTVREVVSLGRTPHATGVVIDQEVVCQAMQSMDISHLADRLYTQLSGGEKQRTQLARIMTQIWREEDATTRLLVLDEPSAALDLGHQQQLMEAVVNFSKQGVAVLMVVHDINIASRYADRLLALKEGNSVAMGRVSDVLQPTLLQQLFDADLCLIEHPQLKKPMVI